MDGSKKGSVKFRKEDVITKLWAVFWILVGVLIGSLITTLLCIGWVFILCILGLVILTFFIIGIGVGSRMEDAEG